MKALSRMLCTGFFAILIAVSTVQSASGQTQSAASDWAQTNSILDDTALIEDGRVGLAALYNMRFETADSIFSNIESRFPGHPVGPFLKALVVWWRILPRLEMGAVDEDELFYGEMERVIDLADEMLDENKDSFDAMFFKGAALGFRGRLRSNRQEWLTAAMDGRATLDYIFEIADADSTNADFQFGRGVYDFFASVIPDRYPLVRPMMVFFPNADKNRGLKNLKFTAEEGRFIQTEAVYFLLQIYLSYERNFDEAKKYATWLRTAYPQNAYFHVLEGRVYATWSRWAEAVAVFRSVVVEFDNGTVGYNDLLASQALYYIGRSKMLSGKLEDALHSFNRVLEIGQLIPVTTYFESFATLRTGMVYDIQGRRNEALQQYEKVLDLPDQGDAHDRAKRYRRARYGGATGSSGSSRF